MAISCRYCLFHINPDLAKVTVGNNEEKSRGSSNMERRREDRRVSAKTPPFPLMTVSGRIMEDRRKQPDRRISNIQALFLNVIDGDRQ